LIVSSAALSLGYGLVGSAIQVARRRTRPIGRRLEHLFSTWQTPLQLSAIFLSAVALFATLVIGLDLVGWTFRALIGLPFRQIVELATVQVTVRVLSLSGLLYLALAVAHRRPRWGITASGLLLASWILYAFFVEEWGGLDRLQWYSVPTGIYLLAVGYVESRTGSARLVRWIDNLSIVLIVGSAFWQTLVLGWLFALQLGIEGLALFWWGSARRLRRFFYAGILAVVLATLGQLINALQSINQWLVFGIIGLILFLIGALGERRFEELRASFEEILEEWE
jgi:hypothetical protein